MFASMESAKVNDYIKLIQIYEVGPMQFPHCARLPESSHAFTTLSSSFKKQTHFTFGTHRVPSHDGGRMFHYEPSGAGKRQQSSQFLRGSQ
jgi:hypothetical protein